MHRGNHEMKGLDSQTANWRWEVGKWTQSVHLCLWSHRLDHRVWCTCMHYNITSVLATSLALLLFRQSRFHTCCSVLGFRSSLSTCGAFPIISLSCYKQRPLASLLPILHAEPQSTNIQPLVSWCIHGTGRKKTHLNTQKESCQGIVAIFISNNMSWD